MFHDDDEPPRLSAPMMADLLSLILDSDLDDTALTVVSAARAGGA